MITEVILEQNSKDCFYPESCNVSKYTFEKKIGIKYAFNIFFMY